jgi:hypothetical protein
MSNEIAVNAITVFENVIVHVPEDEGTKSKSDTNCCSDTIAACIRDSTNTGLMCSDLFAALETAGSCIISSVQFVPAALYCMFSTAACPIVCVAQCVAQCVTQC